MHDPVALPVRWHPAAPELADHWANIHRLPAGAAAEPLALAGRIEHLAEIYRSIPSGRLVILGPAGAGKTVLASRLALGLLDTRRPGQPVPIIVSVGSWNPKTTPFRVWLAAQLARDHPGLAAPVSRGGPTRADALIDADRVLPILDGFDEIDAGLHQAALRQLNATPDVPTVITSRTTEYTTAVHGADALTAAAVVELDDLTINDLDDYLPRTAAGSRTGIWDPVLARMRTQPHTPGPAALRQVMTNPLMVFLARTIYSDAPGHDPAELLATHRFPTTQALEDHLLAAFVPAVYQANQPGRTPRWPADRAHRYLTHLAGHLHDAGTRDLAWWQLRDTIPRPHRTLIFALLDGLLTGLVVGLAGMLATGNEPRLLVEAGLSFGLAAALASGLTVALTVGITRMVRSQRLRVMPRFLSGKSTIAIIVGVAVGGVVGSSWILGHMLMKELLHDTASSIGMGPTVGLMAGLGAGLAAGFIGLRSAGPQPTRTRLRIRGQARFIAGRFVAGLVAVLVLRSVFALLLGVFSVGLTVQGIVGGFLAGLVSGLPYGIVFGLVAAVAFGFEAPVNAADAVRAADSLARDRRNTIRKMLAVWLAVLAVAAGFGATFVAAVGAAVVVGFVGVRATSAWIYWLVLVRGWLPLTGRLPWRVQAFLTDAHQRGVLRQTGTVYQFRHARLQDHLNARTPATAEPGTTA